MPEEIKNRYFDTSFLELNGVKYCPYCGKKLTMFEEHFGQYDIETYWNCNCEDALKEYQIKKQIRTLELQLPRHRFSIKPLICPLYEK